MALANYEEAKRRIEEVRQVNTDRFGLAHPATLRSTANLSMCIQHESRFEEAEGIKRQVPEVGIPHMGPTHAFILPTLHNTAFLLQTGQVLRCQSPV